MGDVSLLKSRVWERRGINWVQKYHDFPEVARGPGIEHFYVEQKYVLMYAAFVCLRRLFRVANSYSRYQPFLSVRAFIVHCFIHFSLGRPVGGIDIIHSY